MNAASSIIPFENEEFGVIRALRDETGEPWFVAKDVCDALGIANNRDAIKALDDDEKNTVVISALRHYVWAEFR